LELVLNVFVLYTKTSFGVTNIWNRTFRFCMGLHYQQRHQYEVRFCVYVHSEWLAIQPSFFRHVIQRRCQLTRCTASLTNYWMKIEQWKN